MYSNLPNLVLAFHGCDQSAYENVLYHHESLEFSRNSYDWLGNGMYFWENSYERAVEWAESHSKSGQPAVIGAVIDLGHCLNLTDYSSTEILKLGYALLKIRCFNSGIPMPKNTNLGSNKDLLNRKLDCAVIQQIHDYNKQQDLRPYDSVRGVFFEGAKVYPTSGFREKTHVQLCITNPNCIKGYFNPMIPDRNFLIP